MIHKKFYEKAYLKEWETQIIQIQREEGKLYALLESTIFYPTGGGQPADHGTINDVAVLDVFEKEGQIYHQIEKELPLGKAHLVLDWERRWDFMQQHSGEHLLSGLILREYQGENRGFHMGKDFVTIDINLSKMSKKMLDHVEALANEAIQRGQKLETHFTDAQHMKNYKPRKYLELPGEIRLVQMGELDCCPCCGTHVQDIHQVGMLKIIKTEAYKGMTRISLVCGNRAYKDYKKRLDIMARLKVQLQSDEESLSSHIQRIQEEITKGKELLWEAKKQLVSRIAQEIRSKQEKKLFQLFPDLDQDHLNLLIQELKEEMEVMVVGCGTTYRVMGESKQWDMGKLFKENIQHFGGKGGGRGSHAQGSFQSQENLQDFIQFLQSKDGAEQ